MGNARPPVSSNNNQIRHELSNLIVNDFSGRTLLHDLIKTWCPVAEPYEKGSHLLIDHFLQLQLVLFADFLADVVAGQNPLNGTS